MTTSSPKMILSLLSPIILGLDRLETASLLGSAVTFQYLTGLPSYLIRKACADFYCRLILISENNYTGSMITCCSGSFTNPITARG